LRRGWSRQQIHGRGIPFGELCLFLGRSCQKLNINLILRLASGETPPLKRRTHSVQLPVLFPGASPFEEGGI
jgi:hypothetical protein